MINQNSCERNLKIIKKGIRVDNAEKKNEIEETQKYVFLDKTSEPTEDQLEEVLGDTYKYWCEIQDGIKSKYGETTPEWKFYMKKTGWTRKTMLKKRNLFFFQPYEKYFSLTFIFGDKAVAEIEKSNISQKLVEELLSAKKYAEGRGILVPVTKNSDIKDIRKLIEIKINY